MFGKKKDRGEVRSAGYQDEIILDEFGNIVPAHDDLEGVVQAVLADLFQGFAVELGNAAGVRQRRRRQTRDEEVFKAIVGG